MGEFIKVSEQTRVQRYTSFAQICVYLDLSKELPEAICMKWEDEEWIQSIDYEQLPFLCRNCHKCSHLGRGCPKMKAEEGNPGHKWEGEGEKDGFTQVKSKQRSKGGGSSKSRREPTPKTLRSTNPFEVLGEEKPDLDNSKEMEPGKTQKKEVKNSNGEEVRQMEIMEEDEGEEMELGELYLDAIEEECGKKGKGYVPWR